MKSTLLTLAAATLVGLSLGLAACKKDDKVTVPEPTKSLITGRIDPPGSVKTVQADGNGRTYQTTLNDSTRSFMLNDVVPGTYTVSFQPATGFPAPPSQTVMVPAGGVADMGTVSASSTAANTMEFTLNGTTTVTASTTTGLISSAGLTLVGRARQGMLAIYVGDMSGPGTYPLEAGSNSVFATYTDASNNVWSTSAAGSSGVLYITEVNSVSRSVSGQFEFIANPKSAGATGALRVSSGEFNEISYR